MARISYDEQTATAFKAGARGATRRTVGVARGGSASPAPVAGNDAGRHRRRHRCVRRRLQQLVRPQRPRGRAVGRDAGSDPADVRALEGDACALPLPDAAADAAWLSLVIHHIQDLGAAAREIRRVLRPGAPVLIRQGYPDRYEPAGPLKLDGIEIARWFPETARALETFPSLTDTWSAFEAAGFRRHALEQVRETYPASLADFLGEVDTFRRADTTMRNLTEDEFLRGKERLRRAVRQAESTANPEPRGNWLDLLVLR